MNKIRQPKIRDLGVIGDQITCAIIDKNGMIGWYCPHRFDKQSFFTFLIDNAGSFWSVEGAGKTFMDRRYEGKSGILITRFYTRWVIFGYGLDAD